MVPLADVGKLVRESLDGLVSTILTKTRLQCVPPHLDMGQVSQELVETNSILRSLVQKQQVSQPTQLAPTNHTATLERAIRGLSTRVGDLAAEIRLSQMAQHKMVEAAVAQAKSVEKMVKALESQTAAVESANKRHLQQQAGLVRALQCQQEAFNAVTKRFNGLIEDEKRGGGTTKGVRRILNVDDPEFDKLCEEAKEAQPEHQKSLFGPLIDANRPVYAKEKYSTISPNRDGWDGKLREIRQSQKL